MPLLMTPREADRLLRYPRGRSVRLAKKNKLPHVKLPDGSYRFPGDLIDQLLGGASSATPRDQLPDVDVLGRIGVEVQHV